MKKFSKVLRGYDPKEVNAFLDDIILKVENIVKESKEKDTKIKELENIVNKYKTLESNINSTFVNAQENSERLRQMANQEKDTIINEARRNANKIISDSLYRAEKVQYEAEVLKRNINLFKKRIKSMLEQQMDLVEDMDKEDF